MKLLRSFATGVALCLALVLPVFGQTNPGTSPQSVLKGGTGATTASGARSNLGLVIGTNVQAYDAELACLAGLTSAADKVAYFTGSGTCAVTDFTSFGRSLAGVANASAGRTALGVAIGSDVQAYHARLADLAGISWAQGDIVYYNGSNLVKLAAGTSGYYLKTLGAGANPAWASVAGGGTTPTVDYIEFQPSGSVAGDYFRLSGQTNGFMTAYMKPVSQGYGVLDVYPNCSGGCLDHSGGGRSWIDVVATDAGTSGWATRVGSRVDASLVDIGYIGTWKQAGGSPHVASVPLAVILDTSTEVARFTTSGMTFTDNTYDIGASGATRPRTGYFGTSVVTPLVTATTVDVGSTDTTIARSSAGNISIEGNLVYRAGGTDVPVADGGTGSSTAAGAATNLGLGTGDSPQFTAVNIGAATDTTVSRASAGDIAVEGNLIYRAGGTDVPVTDGGTGLSAGTSGGIPYYSTTTAMASSALLTQYGVIYGGGAGAAPVATAAGTTGQILTATTSAAPAWAATATAANYYAAASGKVVTTDIVYPSEVTVTFNATQTIDMDTFINGVITLTANMTSMTLSNVRAGKSGLLTFIQDGTGSRTITFDTKFKFAGGTIPTLTTTASAIDVLSYSCRTTTFCIASLAKNVKNP